jgi:hypothetical protein
VWFFIILLLVIYFGKEELLWLLEIIDYHTWVFSSLRIIAIWLTVTELVQNSVVDDEISLLD